MAPSSVEEFERQYAERSGVTVEFLHDQELFGVTCECGDEICEGFQMTHRAALLG